MPEELPIVASPVLSIEKSVDVPVCVEDAMTKSIVFVAPLSALIEKLANGVVVPKPNQPCEVKVEVAVAPKDAPLKKLRAVEVALFGKR